MQTLGRIVRVVVLAGITLTVGAAPKDLAARAEFDFTNTDEYYASCCNLIGAVTQGYPDATMEHYIDGARKWWTSSGAPTGSWSVQYPGPENCAEGQEMFVHVRHVATDEDNDEHDVLNHLTFTCALNPM